MVDLTAYPRKEYKINRWVIIGLVVSLIINTILLLSPKFTVNPWLFIVVGLVVMTFLVLQYLTTRVIEKDAYDVVKDIENTHFKKNGEQLDTTEYYVEEIAKDTYLIEFWNDAKTFTYRVGKVKGILRKSLKKKLDNLEKSKLMEAWLSMGKAESEIRTAARHAGVVIPGLTDEEDGEE